jgi:hypothetical protein
MHAQAQARMGGDECGYGRASAFQAEDGDVVGGFGIPVSTSQF